jgi:hypothetical protein
VHPGLPAICCAAIHDGRMIPAVVYVLQSCSYGGTDGAFDNNLAAWLISMESSAPIRNHFTDESAPSTSSASPLLSCTLVPELLNSSSNF